MGQPAPQLVLGKNVTFQGEITARRVPQEQDNQDPADGPPTPENATEGPASRVRYSAKVTGALPMQYSQVTIEEAQPYGGRPSNDVVLVYAKVGDRCDINIPESGPARLYVYDEKIRFTDCATSAPVVAGRLVLTPKGV